MFFETETSYECSYPFSIKEIDKNYIPLNPTLLTIGKTYEAITRYLGFSVGDDGKTMGLASYGKSNPLIPTLLNNREIFTINSEKGTPLGDFVYPLEDTLEFKKDLAWKIQQETQRKVGDYVEYLLSTSTVSNIVCSGGYFLNCVANYYLKKRFPKVNFYFDPISHDGGTSLGACLYRWAELNNELKPPKTLYLGPKYSKKELLKGIKKYI